MASKTSLTPYRFYRPLVTKAWGDLAKSKAFWAKLVAMTVATAAFFFNQKIVASISALADFHGFSRWWAVAPASLVFIYYFLRANYQNFQEQEHTANDALEQERDKTVRAQEQLAALNSAIWLRGEWRDLEKKFSEYMGQGRLNLSACWRRDESTGKLSWFLSGGLKATDRERLEVVIREAANLLSKRYRLDQFNDLESEDDFVGKWALTVLHLADADLVSSGKETNGGVLTAVTGHISEFPRKSGHACALLAAQQRVTPDMQ